jgi:hypothetical protein
MTLESKQYPTIPKPIARMIGEPSVWHVKEESILPTIAQFETEYPWSDWSEWERCGPEEIVSEEEAGSYSVATEVTLFKVLRYEHVKRYRTKYRQQWWRFRRNAKGECEGETRWEYWTEIA